jgi:hypothetical protein
VAVEKVQVSPDDLLEVCDGALVFTAKTSTCSSPSLTDGGQLLLELEEFKTVDSSYHGGSTNHR